MKATNTDEPLLLTLNEAAHRLSVSRRTIEREISVGRFPRPLKVGRSTRIAVTDLHAYIEILRQPGARGDLIAASVSKQGAVRPDPDILSLISKLRPEGMRDEDYEKLQSQYHDPFQGHGP